MNDYNKLIDELKELLSLNDENLQSLIIENNDLQNTLANALDAIEQLAKERDESKKNCDSCAKKTTNCITWLQEELAKIQKERDAAVADLGRYGRWCVTCKHRDKSDFSPNCTPIKCSTDKNEFWEWRGVQEDNDEID